MPRSALKLLADVQAAGAAILEYTSGMSEEDYLTNRTVWRAAEREFEIIGEAMRRLSQEDSSVAIQVSSASQVIAFRNVLAHGYDIVEDEIVWSIVVKQLPRLLEEVRKLHAQLAGRGR